MRLAGKVAIVTGAANGMGRATAELFAEHGANVVAGDIVKPDPALPDNVEFVDLDVTSEQDWLRVVGETESRHGKVDVLVNNAGIIAYEPIDELDMDGWAKVIGVNQTGVFLGIRSVVPAMRKAGGGSVINFSSIWGNVAVAGAAAYHATKGAVRNLSKNAAMTYATENIRVNSVHPGIIHTPLVDRQDEEVNKAVVASTPMGRMGQPREIANGVLFLASDESSFMTGAELVIDGGYTAQ
ncbi:MAG: glucose 1-dehydrogenase [Pseudonocardiaceae bacterium]|nr:glucose 1-dehydrogenase [Pseudonocardiaceae bacterium]